jgi:hypothetical protein
MRSEHAHIYIGRGRAGKADAAAARATYSSLRRELRIWYRRLARKLRAPTAARRYVSGRP